jgi:type VI secretion system secreted protein Hcp
MAHKIFLRLEGIQGESTDRTHRDEIEVLGWNWSFTNTQTTTGGGGGGGRPVVSGITFNHKIDKTSPVLMRSCLVGSSIRDAKLSVVKVGGRIEFDQYVILVKDVKITSVIQTESDDLSSTLETVTFAFTNVTEEYTITKPDGTAGQKVTATYDIRTNT